MKQSLAVAVDVGSSTVSGRLINLTAKKKLAINIVPNAQIKFGRDIISRISLAQSRDERSKLHKAAISSINECINGLCKASGADKKSIIRVVACGNTVMHHLSLDLPVDTLGVSPYKPFITGGVELKARTLGLTLSKDARFKFLPNLASFVGSDALCVVLSTAIYKSDRPSIAVDLGTNGEVIAASSKKILAASTAAGPAFEGGNISCGMPGIKGAIDSFKFSNNKIKFTTIGDVQPKGLCGSGLIDVCAGLLRAGLINKGGRLGEEFAIHKKIKITPQDIRQLQLAKAAVKACVNILIKYFDVSPKSFKNIFIAGTFGNRLNIENVLSIGLLPEDLRKKIIFAPHAALAGAEMVLMDEKNERLFDRIRSRAQHIHLFGRADFKNEFIESMAF